MGRGYGSGAGSEPETHPKVSFAACVDDILLLAAPPMYGSAAAPRLQVLPRFVSPPTPLSRTPASYVWRFASPPNMVVAGAAPPRSLRRVSAVSLLLQGTAAPRLQVLPRFASHPTPLSRTPILLLLLAISFRHNNCSAGPCRLRLREGGGKVRGPNRYREPYWCWCCRNRYCCRCCCCCLSSCC